MKVVEALPVSDATSVDAPPRAGGGGRRSPVGVRDEAAPAAGPRDVLIDVAAAGVNPADALQLRGLYAVPEGWPSWPGLEVSGTVAAVGGDVRDVAPGDRVMALLGGGGWAEQVVAPASLVMHVPDGVDLLEAAALPEALCTAWSNLVDAGGLGRGDRALVHGGSGGVGTVAVQLAHALGAWVATTAGGPERAARCLDLGADLAIDHRGEDFVARVREATADDARGPGADVVLDVVGAAYLGPNVEVLATDGRLVVIGTQRGSRGELDLGALLAKRAAVVATTLRARPAAEKDAIVAAVREHVLPMVADGRVRPVVGAVLPFERADDALDLLGSGQVFGKVLLAPHAAATDGRLDG